jgi:NADH-quinone oxidoreductase subunit J
MFLFFTISIKNFRYKKFMKILHLLLCVLIIICAFSVCLALNSIESIIFLILTFFNSAILLFLFCAEFLSLTFIIVYVGAVAVLFLFVIMMLNVKITENIHDTKTKILKKIDFVFVLLGFHFCFLIFLLIYKTFTLNSTGSFLPYYRYWENLFIFDSLSNIDILGQTLFNEFFFCFLIAGFILLIALIGAIVLTLRFDSSQKGQTTFRQLSRSSNLLSFFH